MRASSLIFGLALLFPLAGHAEQASTRPHGSATKSAPRADQPRPLGRFEDWTAATHIEGTRTVCYAFTRARSSNPKIPGRGEVILTVTERPTSRDTVAISAGYTYPPNATVRLLMDKTAFDFYTAQRSGFARDGHAVVNAMHRHREAIAHAPSPRGVGTITDVFSLRGFSAAYARILKACPSK